MANIKSRKKQVRKDALKNNTNKRHKSSLKTSLKHFNTAIEANDKEKARELLLTTTRLLDRSVTQGVHTKNYVNRHKSNIHRRYNTLEA